MATANKINPILERWQETLARFGPKTAIFEPNGSPLRNFCEIEEESRALAGLIDPLAPGSVVAIRIGNSPSWPAILLACWRRGLVPLPMGRHIERGEREEALRACGAVATVEAGLVLERTEGTPGTGVATNLAATIHLLKLTSGTTSAPRGILFRGEQLVADCDNVCETMGIGPADLNFGVIPFSHSYGFSNLVTPLICRGVPLVASEDRMPRAILNGLATTGATVFPGMPVFYQSFAGMEGVPPLPKLRLCISAGAPLLAEVGRRFTAKFGLKIHTFYGASECGGMAYDDSDSADYEEGCLGRPMRNVSITHADSRIEIRGAAVGEGYYPEPEPETLGSGRFIPGDLIENRDGRLFLVGRASDIINVAGRKLNPLEVEASLRRVPGVREVVVFGVPSALRNEEAVACVAGEVSREELLRHCRAELSGWQVPKDFWMVESIPVNERGKISRRVLCESYSGRVSRGDR